MTAMYPKPTLTALVEARDKAKREGPRGQTAEILRKMQEKRLMRLSNARMYADVIVDTTTEAGRSLKESVYFWDTAGPVIAALDSARSPGLLNLITGSMDNRKGGKNWPLWRTELELSRYRMASQLLVDTNPYAEGLVGGLAAYTIGEGSVWRTSVKDDGAFPEGVSDADKQAFGEALSKQCQRIIDRNLRHNQWHGGEYPSLELEFFVRTIMQGEAILNHVERDDGLIDLRTLEPEQLTSPSASADADDSFGVINAPGDVQNIVAYRLALTNDPGKLTDVLADKVTHFRRNVPRGVKRGFPDFAFGTYDALKLADILRGNLGEAGAEQAAIVSVMQFAVGTEDELRGMNLDNADEKVVTVKGETVDAQRSERGRNEQIPQGQQYVSPPTAQNGAVHISILQALLRAAAVRMWNAPEWLASGDASNNNFSSSLVAESPFVRQVKFNQGLYARAFERTGWLAIRHWAKTKKIMFRGREVTFEEIENVIDLKVSFPSPESRNPLQDAQTDQAEITAGFSSPQQAAEKRGYDYKKISKDRTEHLADFGGGLVDLPLPSDKPGATATGGGGK